MLFSERYFMLSSSSSEKDSALGWEYLQSGPPSIGILLFERKVLFVSRPKRKRNIGIPGYFVE
jgi:hypothetical protein